MTMIGGLGVIIGLLWGWALPVFFLIWFSRAGVRSEVRSWSDEQIPAEFKE